MSNNITIAEAEASGYTHIEARCRCGRIACIPFRMLKEKHGARASTALGNIASRLRCERELCGSKPETWRPWRQYIDGGVGGYGHTQ